MKRSSNETAGFAPVYPPSFDPYVPTPQQVSDAAAFSSAPTNAADFFAQMGQGLVESPLPTRRTALSGTPLRMLPSWVIPQYGAKQTYMVPAFGQKRTLERFASIGLTAAGWTQPSNWGPDQLAAFAREDPDGRKGPTNVAHYVTNIAVDATPPGARGHGYLLTVTTAPPAPAAAPFAP